MVALPLLIAPKLCGVDNLPTSRLTGPYMTVYLDVTAVLTHF
jgi:hypothetical protein